MKKLQLSDYDYFLPPELIAQSPTFPQHESKMLVFQNWKILDKKMSDLPEFLKNCLIFFNDTKVIKSRIVLQNVKIKKHTWVEKIIETWEIFLLEKLWEKKFEALILLDKRTRPWIKIFLEDIVLEIEKLTNKWVIFCSSIWVDQLLEKYGQMPLPPYIENNQNLASAYQNPFGKNEWSVASPTASLHITDSVFEKLEKSNQIEFIQLHIGLGTFKPVFETNITNHQMHSEKALIKIAIFRKIFEAKFSISMEKSKNKTRQIVAIWTTSARVLESLPYVWSLLDKNLKNNFSQEIQNFWDKKSGSDINSQNNNQEIIKNLKIFWKNINFETSIFLYPWKDWKIVDILKTNFHLPSSTLLMLVASFVGYENMKKIYAHAIKKSYKFYSFWDGCLLFK